MRAIAAAAAFALAARCAVAQEFKTLRYEEDWSFLRDDRTRASALDALKYVPLDGAGNWFLSLGGDARLKYERYSEPALNQSPTDRNGFLLQRYLLHADLHATESFRAFAQLQSSLENGRAGGARPTDSDRLDLHQLFVDLAAPSSSVPSTLRLGRQELAYGSQRLVSVRDSPNNRLGFDAARAIARPAGWRVDAFVARPVKVDPGVFDDTSHGNPTFWGVYATGPSRVVEGLSLDVYYLGIERADAEFAAGIEREQRHSLGTRIFGRRGALDWNFEVVGQLGSFGDDSIRAWTIASDTGWTFRAPASPRLFLRADVVSGDHGGSTLGTFNPLFPKGAYFNEAALIGPQNLLDLQPGIELSLPRNVGLSLSCDWVWRQSKDDGVYGTALNLQVAPGESDARFVGAFPTASLRWQPDRHLTFALYWVGYQFGAFVTESRPEQQNGSYVSALATFRF
jgi:hypothetical protein